MRFIFNDSELNLTAGLLIKDGQTISIRAKTLLVLKYLITHKAKIVSKQEILASVWHDVVVQEQVLVQSIKEIRDLLGSHVIKTYPRQGYQWTAELNDISKQYSFFGKPVNRASLVQIAALLLLAIIGLVVYSLASNNSSTKAAKFTVAFLPIINDMPDDIHDWVPLQGMDYLSAGLKKSSQLQLIPRVALLQSLPFANQENFQHSDSQKLPLLAQALKVDLLVQTRLRGYPQDFQLDYSFYLGQRVEQGVILAADIATALEQLVQKIALRFDPNAIKTSQPYISNFSNEAFARGIELYLQREYLQASTFFATALQSNTDLLAARRYLAASYINSGDIEQGITLMKVNISQARHKQMHREEIRSHLMIGALLIHRYQNDSQASDDLTEAELYIQLTKTLAEQYQDTLFIAYALEELAKIRRLQQQYQQAIPLLAAAMQYHKEFKGSYGQTRALIELALIAFAQDKETLGQDYFSQATTIANQNGVATNKVAILLAQAQVALTAQQIEQAKAIAIKAKSNVLIAQVSAWLAENNSYQVN